MLLRLPSGSVSEAVALMPCSRLTGLITSRPGSSTLRTLDRDLHGVVHGVVGLGVTVLVLTVGDAQD